MDKEIMLQTHKTLEPLINLEKGLIELKQKYEKQDLPKYWEQEHISMILEGILNYQHKMLIQFLRMSGCRITEALNIRKKDLDFKNYIMSIRWLKSRKYNTRNIPLHPNLKNMLEVYVATMKEEDKVFPISRQRGWQIVNKYFKGSPHQFRHSFAVHWLKSGGDIIALSRILGHSDIKTTMVYLQIVPIDQGKELIKIRF